MTLNAPLTSSGRPRTAGFSATELLVAVQIVGILAAIAVSSVGDVLDRARLARRMDELRGLQAAMWSASDNGLAFPSPAVFWSRHARGAGADTFGLLVDVGGVDLANAAAEGADTAGGDQGRRRVEFVFICDDDFGRQAEYVYIEAHGPPEIVTGRDDDPGYRRFTGGDEGGRSGGPSGPMAGSSASGGSAGTASETLVGWSGADMPRTESPVRDFISKHRREHDDGSEPAPPRGSGATSSSRIGD